MYIAESGGNSIVREPYQSTTDGKRKRKTDKQKQQIEKRTKTKKESVLQNLKRCIFCNYFCGYVE